MKRIALLAILTAVAACGSDSPTTPTTGPIVFTAAVECRERGPAGDERGRQRAAARRRSRSTRPAMHPARSPEPGR